MSRGGARNRSGPPVDPKSLRSAERGFVLTALPNEGYDGDAPEFPLPRMSIHRWEFEDKRRFQVFDADATEAFRERETDLWVKVWTYPQACAWSLEPWRWNTVAMWVRTFVVCEGSEATAADKSSLHRFADQIGLTPAGLKENGWAIAANQIAAKTAERTAERSGATTSARDRMKIVPGGGGV